MSEIARETSVHQKVIVSYFDILEDLLLGFRVPVFTKRAKRKTVQHPKFFFFDVGIFQTLRPKGFLDSPQEIAGPALETLFLQEFRALNDYLKLEYQIYYWRTETGLEVDFIVYGPRGLFAFEIKQAKKVHRADIKALQAFCADYPKTKAFCIYGGEQRYYFDNITVLPILEALKSLSKLLT